EIVPIRNDVVDRTSRLAKRNAAVHATCALPRGVVVGEREDEFAIVRDPTLDRLGCFLDSLQLDEARDLSHLRNLTRLRRFGGPRLRAFHKHFAERALVFDREYLDELRALIFPVVEDRQRDGGA